MFSIRLRTRLWEIALAAIVVLFVWLLQTCIITRLSLGGVLCDLPLTFTIIWASIFGSRFTPLANEDLRILSLGEIVTYQALSGSLSGALVGALFASLYSAMLPVYPICYPLIGWIAGYFPLKNLNHAAIFSIPFVLLVSVLAESFMACQLYYLGRPEVISRFIQFALTTATLNALIAPFIFLPMQKWYQFSTADIAEI